MILKTYMGAYHGTVEYRSRCQNSRWVESSDPRNSNQATTFKTHSSIHSLCIAGQEFPSFPYNPPYDIQLGFMRSLYTALEKGGVGFFESPTGTGKTLSLICGSLTWLQDIRDREEAERKAKEALENSNTNNGNQQQAPLQEEQLPDWMQDFESQQEDKRRQLAEEERAKRIAKAKAKLEAKMMKRKGAGAGVGVKKQGDNLSLGDNLGDEDNAFLLDEVDDTDDTAIVNGGGITTNAAGEWQGRRKRMYDGFSSSSSSSSDDDGDDDELAALLRETKYRGSKEEEGAATANIAKKTQIIFCSRTHSQLTQFVGELHKTPFADTMALVALGSRRALCINDDVLRLKVPSLINERCLEMQKPGSSAAGSRKKAAAMGVAETGGAVVATKRSSRANSAKCPYLASGTKSADTTRDIILAQPIDIEALAELGRKRSVCPYYASRRATPDADLILAPYSALLVEETREALGVRVEGNIIIVDEAHNLADAINGAHSAELSSSTASTALHQLEAYFERFRTQLAPGNARNIQAFIRAAEALSKIASASSTTANKIQTKTAWTVNDFLFSAGLDNVNMFQLVRHMKQSKAVFKVAGYWQSLQRKKAKEAAEKGEERDPASPATTGPLHSLLSFLQALTNEDADGRVVCDPTNNVVKFILLNAAAHFASIVSSARAIILASGTLSPMETVMRLFPTTLAPDITQYSCGHVVGGERLLAVAVGSGPSGHPLDFRHGTRSHPATIDELGRLVVNACTASPGGVVVFFPSFAYIEEVVRRWTTSGGWRSLQDKKKVFREPRNAGDVDSMLEEYSDACRAAGTSTGKATRRGAVMLCVVGGKLAEGINFGDELGRCIIMVGLPYPNPSDPELQERLKYIDRCAGQQQLTASTVASREHYSNLCMKAVNQCIGRAIRHRQDYAAIMLVDVRYASLSSSVASASASSGVSSNAVLMKLPLWIQQSLVVCSSFGEAYGRLVRFYKGIVTAATALQ